MYLLHTIFCHTRTYCGKLCAGIIFLVTHFKLKVRGVRLPCCLGNIILETLPINYYSDLCQLSHKMPHIAVITTI